MTAWVVALLAGGVTGILSAFGIGGGSLLLIYLTSFAALDQHQAQGINLLYFLPAILAGLAAAGIAAWISTGLDTRLLRKLFGVFLLYVGVTQLMQKDEPNDPPKH